MFERENSGWIVLYHKPNTLLVLYSQPNVLNFPFLEKLDLKMVIWLAPDDPTEILYVLSFGQKNLLYS